MAETPDSNTKSTCTGGGFQHEQLRGRAKVVGDRSARAAARAGIARVGAQAELEPVEWVRGGETGPTGEQHEQGSATVRVVVGDRSLTSSGAAARAPTGAGALSLKLLVDSKREKVLFAEAGKDFVDFLFSLLSLPVSTITTLLGKDGMVGSFGQLFESVENLSDTYMQPYINKDILLKPKAPIAGSPNFLGLLESPAQNKVLYMCSPSPMVFGGAMMSHHYVTEDPSERCPSCNNFMSKEATYVGQPKTTSEAGSGVEGFVKGVVTYMIMDDLEVKPMSTISSITLLDRFKVKDLSALEERVVHFCMDEGVKLLKESLNSNSVLTNVFLLGKKATA